MSVKSDSAPQKTIYTLRRARLECIIFFLVGSVMFWFNPLKEFDVVGYRFTYVSLSFHALIVQFSFILVPIAYWISMGSVKEQEPEERAWILILGITGAIIAVWAFIAHVIIGLPLRMW